MIELGVHTDNRRTLSGNFRGGTERGHSYLSSGNRKGTERGHSYLSSQDRQVGRFPVIAFPVCRRAEVVVLAVLDEIFPRFSRRPP